VVADLVQKAGFPQHLLPPVNFDALYLQQKQREASSESAQPAAAVTH
jgi:preprotein translocase subunit SecB